MTIATSNYTVGPVQADGRVYVTETHVSSDGTSYEYSYLTDSLNPEFVMEERVKVLNATLAAREAARQAVLGTSVPLTRFQFLDRFTAAERVGVRAVAATDPIVEDFMEMMKLSGNVSLVLARPGLQYLASIGRLTAARAAEIGAE